MKRVKQTDQEVMYAKLKAVTLAARELAQMLSLEQLQKVSKPTAKWIAENWHLFKLDKTT